MTIYEVRNRSNDNDTHLGYYKKADNAIIFVLENAIKIDRKFYRCTSDLIDAVYGGEKSVKFNLLEEVERFLREGEFKGDNLRRGVRCMGGFQYIVAHDTVD